MKLTVIREAMEKAGLPLFAIAPFSAVRALQKEPSFDFGFEPKSVLFAAFAYGRGNAEGNLARYARGRDYHLELPERLSLAASLFGDAKGRAFADVSPFFEVAAAERAGLGTRGENGLLFCGDYGSFCLLGEWVTKTELPAFRPIPQKGCIHCGLCRKTCPGGALAEAGFSESCCLSAITQRKGILSSREEELIRKNGLIWGCDTCQCICPVNQQISGEIRETRTSLTLFEIESLSNRAFRKAYRESAFSYRGKDPLVRNLKLFEK